jgi:hypothetical protein
VEDRILVCQAYDYADLWFDFLGSVDDSASMVRAFFEWLHQRDKQALPPPTLLAGMYSKYQL